MITRARMHALAALLLGLLLPHAALAEVRTETVSYRSGPDTVSGFLALPPSSKAGKAGAKRPAVIVIHEWWGQNDWVKDKARGFAGKGYVALAVDLYRGGVASDPDTAHQLMRGLPEDRAARDLAAAFSYLGGRPDVDAARIGVIGWCMGGGYSLVLALREPRLAAAVIYYGRLVTDPAEIAKIKAPLLGNFGATDKGISADSVKTFADAARQAGVRADFKIYPGVGHAFASSKDPKVFNTEAARDADARSDDFLAKHLRP